MAGGLDVAGRRVAVVGTGASAIQIVPAVAGTTVRVSVFQRSVPWTFPKFDRRYGPVRGAVVHRVPATLKIGRAAWLAPPRWAWPRLATGSPTWW